MPRDEKDTIMKALTGALSEDSLKALGISGVRVTKPLPTELETLKQHVDMLWQMDDGRLFHLEFQTNREASLHRFLMYDARLAEQYKVRIRTVILYHGTVQNAPEDLNIGSAQYHVENVYLGSFDGDVALDAVARHLDAQEWTPEDRWRLALAMNMRFTQRSHEEAFGTVLKLVKRLSDEQERDFVVAGILGLTERVLTQSEQNRIRQELIEVSRIAKEIHKDGVQEGRLEGRVEGRVEALRETARKALIKGMSAKDISELTGLSLSEVDAIKRELH